MKTQYALQINSLLENYHFDIEFEGKPRSNALISLRCGVMHLYYLGVTLGDAGAETLEEIRGVISQILDEEVVPQPYDVTAFTHASVRHAADFERPAIQ
ncbi:hypothetical protein GWD52_13935 [Enterobacteriaceae bacterium 4M9]|nr:hypothetical protein [Enterobacteriaceae bacterium 4M9]